MVIITQSKSSTDAESLVHFHYSADRAPESLGENKLLVSFLFSPINPQDLLVIAGRYPVKPSFTRDAEPILGYDGVARVEAVGAGQSSVRSPIQVGDLIIPRRHGLGTWRSQAVFDAADVVRLSPTEDPIGASLLRLNFLPAYLLIEDMRELKPGDWVIQNVGSGTIARLVAQFARLKGVHTASVVRNRPDEEFEQLKTELEKGGAEVVITEKDLSEKRGEAHPALADAVSRGRVVLAIDGVFGEPGECLAYVLSHGGTYVNYGSLGGADGVVRLSQRLLFWSEVKFRNFRLTEQLNKRTQAQLESLLIWFQDLLARGALLTPKVKRIQVPVKAEDKLEFEQRINDAVSPGSATCIGNTKAVLEFSRTLVAI